jgi:hypothetical protein
LSAVPSLSSRPRRILLLIRRALLLYPPLIPLPKLILFLFALRPLGDNKIKDTRRLVQDTKYNNIESGNFVEHRPAHIRVPSTHTQ